MDPLAPGSTTFTLLLPFLVLRRRRLKNFPLESFIVTPTLHAPRGELLYTALSPMSRVNCHTMLTSSPLSNASLTWASLTSSEPCAPILNSMRARTPPQFF